MSTTDADWLAAAAAIMPFEFPTIETERYAKNHDLPEGMVIRERTNPLGRTYTQFDCDLCGWYERVWWDKTSNLKASIDYMLSNDRPLGHRCIIGLKKGQIVELFKEVNSRGCHDAESRQMYMEWWEKEKAWNQGEAKESAIGKALTWLGNL